ncbi:MAG: hypothetical protein KDD40_12970, partial [Bdellovibrionales bacterium]|nr:hypothetical protein [Bdellovibrionales bacterium]
MLKRYYTFFIFAPLIALQGYLLISSAFIKDYGGDVYWHLRIGLDWINRGLSPFQDHYSIFYEGQYYKHLSPYLFQ